MKAGIVSLAVVMCLGVMGLGFASSITPALADADDAAWIKKCVSDNKREGATPEVVAAWCSCMNNKMSSEENSLDHGLGKVASRRGRCLR